MTFLEAVQEALLTKQWLRPVGQTGSAWRIDPLTQRIVEAQGGGPALSAPDVLRLWEMTDAEQIEREIEEHRAYHSPEAARRRLCARGRYLVPGEDTE